MVHDTIWVTPFFLGVVLATPVLGSRLPQKLLLLKQLVAMCLN